MKSTEKYNLFDNNLQNLSHDDGLHVLHDDELAEYNQSKFDFFNDELSPSRTQHLNQELHQPLESSGPLARNYDRAAKFYELSAKIFSTNQIKASKRSQLKYINPGDRIVYLGTGGGEDALLAARAGAHVTCVDISAKMLHQVERKLAKENLSAELICQSAFDHERFDHYDICAANYFLNVFREPEMIEMMQHSARLVRPGGRYLIADVALPQGNPLSRVFNMTYLKSAMIGAWAAGLVPVHKNYDYCKHFEDSGLKTGAVEFFRFMKRGPVLFQSIMGERI